MDRRGHSGPGPGFTAVITSGPGRFHGIGTEVDVESAAANLLMASLSGSDDAPKLFSHVVEPLTPAAWERIADRVRWADLILAGPAVEGHLPELSDRSPASGGIE